jgi:hypothetical protein
MLEDGASPPHPVDLLVGERQAREPGDVQDLVAIDHSLIIGTAGRAADGG